LADGERDSLARRVFAHVSGAHEYVGRREVFGKLRRGVRQSAVSESVGGDKVAEFILNAGLGKAGFYR
jgi:hypothetical protein